MRGYERHDERSGSLRSDGVFQGSQPEALTV